jgi:hypothetical protein
MLNAQRVRCEKGCFHKISNKTSYRAFCFVGNRLICRARWMMKQNRSKLKAHVKNKAYDATLDFRLDSSRSQAVMLKISVRVRFLLPRTLNLFIENNDALRECIVLQDNPVSNMLPWGIIREYVKIKYLFWACQKARNFSIIIFHPQFRVNNVPVKSYEF